MASLHAGCAMVSPALRRGNSNICAVATTTFHSPRLHLPHLSHAHAVDDEKPKMERRLSFFTERSQLVLRILRCLKAGIIPDFDLCADPNQYDESWSRSRIRAATLVDSAWFQAMMATMIFINFGLVIREFDLSAEGVDEFPVWMEATSLLFKVCYAAEIACSIYAERSRFFESPINLFDASVVLSELVFSAASTVIETSGHASNFAILRVLRLLRLLRSAKKLFRFRSLYMLIHGMGHAVRGVAWALLLVSLALILCSCFAVAVIHPLNVELAEQGIYEGCERCPRAFSSVWSSYLTFFQQIIAGDSWGVVTVPLMEAHPWTTVFFIPAISFIQLGLVNLILAVIVDCAVEAREENIEMKLEDKTRSLEKTKENLYALCVDMDADRSGTLTMTELLNSYDKHGEFYENMQLMDVDRDDMTMVFQYLDDDRSGTVTYQELVQNLYKMKTQDSHTLLVFIKSCVADIRWHLETKLEHICERVHHIAHNQNAAHHSFKQGEMSAMAHGFQADSAKKDAYPTLLPSTESCNQPQTSGCHEVHQDGLKLIDKWKAEQIPAAVQDRIDIIDKLVDVNEELQAGSATVAEDNIKSIDADLDMLSQALARINTSGQPFDSARERAAGLRPGQYVTKPTEGDGAQENTALSPRLQDVGPGKGRNDGINSTQLLSLRRSASAPVDPMLPHDASSPKLSHRIPAATPRASFEPKCTLPVCQSTGTAISDFLARFQSSSAASANTEAASAEP